jgi:hypothetical protein
MKIILNKTNILAIKVIIQETIDRIYIKITPINNSKIEAKVLVVDLQNIVKIRRKKINLNLNIIKKQILEINNTVKVEVTVKMDIEEIAEALKIWIYKNHIKMNVLIHLVNTEGTVKAEVLASRKKIIKIRKNSPIKRKKVATVEVVQILKKIPIETEINNIRIMIWMRNTINSFLIQKIK